MTITFTDLGQQQVNHQQKHQQQQQRQQKQQRQQQQQQQYTATTSNHNGSQNVTDELRIEIRCTVSNSNSNTAPHIPGGKRKNTASTLASSTCTVPPPPGQPQPKSHLQKYSRSHNDGGGGMIPVSISVPTNAAPTTMVFFVVCVIIVLHECLLSIATLSGTTPSNTTMILPHFFSVQTGDVDTNCSFDNDFKGE